jgi:hypothetical protein
MVVGAHTNGVLVQGSETQVAASEFGIGASILDDCSAFAATTEGAVVVGLRAIGSEYDTYVLQELDGLPLPYSNSVEIIRLPGGSPVTGGRWEAGNDGMLLLILSTADGTHFIEIRKEGD